MNAKLKTNFRLFAVIAALILFACCALFSCTGAEGPCSFAYAQGEYGGRHTEDLWYFGEDALNVEAAKSVVNSWGLASVREPVVIAVVDTGLDVSHELFDGVLLEDADGNAVGYNSYADAALPKADISDSSDDRHGNAVAGIVAMLIKEFGLEDYIKLYPIKASTEKQSSFAITSVSRAIEWAANEAHADVINLSFGLTVRDMKYTDWVNDKALRYAVENAAQSSVIVAAAGNGGLSSDRESDTFYPAAMDGVLSVMNYGEGGVLYSNSNYGSAYDIAAPGVNIYTANTAENSSYANKMGTSMSAPFVSFAAALLQLKMRAEGSAPTGYEVALMLRNIDRTQSLSNGYTYRVLDLNTLVTQDYDNYVYEYADPTGLQISHNGPLGTGDLSDTICMNASGATMISFIAKITPYGATDPDFGEEVEWYLVDENGKESYLAKGLTFNYLPTVFGNTAIKAKLDWADETFEAEQPIYIQYANYLVGDVRVTYLSHADMSAKEAPTEGTLYTTEATSFTLTGLKYLQPQPVKWYVNGEYRATGNVFVFKPTKPGNYRISAQYGDHPRMDYEGFAFTAHVKSFILRPLDLSMLIVSLTLIAAAAATIAVFVVRKEKRGKAS